MLGSVMKPIATWDAVLSSGEGVVNAGKLRMLRRACDELGFANEVGGDPAEVRVAVAARAKSWGLSAGSVHSLDQAFAGLLRRAALQGWVAPLPEGPWSTEWQRVIDKAPGGRRTAIKALAGWAFPKGLKPAQIDEDVFDVWRLERHLRAESIDQARQGLASASAEGDESSATDLLGRLQLRKSKGTTRGLVGQYVSNVKQ